MNRYIVTLEEGGEKSYWLVSADDQYEALELLKSMIGDLGIYRIRLLPMDEVVWVGGKK